MIVKRIKAFALDYIIIFIYILVLLGITLLVAAILQKDTRSVDLMRAQVVGFITLTLPVILYFTISEWSKRSGTFGKRRMKLMIVTSNGDKADLGKLLLRNIIKFLPWEIAHYSVYRLFYYTQRNQDPPAEVNVALVVSLTLALLYLFTMILSKNNRSIYERVSGTTVIEISSLSKRKDW